MLQGMSKEDKFKNHPSVTVVKEDDLCEEKALGCMEIKELGVKLKEGLVKYNVESSRELRVKRTELSTNVGIDLLNESYLYCIDVILTLVYIIILYQVLCGMLC